MTGDEAWLLLTMWEPRGRDRGRTQILQAQMRWTPVRQAQRRSHEEGGWDNVELSLYFTHGSARSIHDSGPDGGDGFQDCGRQ